MQRKESAVTVNSNNSEDFEDDDDGRPPSAMAQWVGKRAQSNRYESWDPTNPEDQQSPVSIFFSEKLNPISMTFDLIF